MEVVFEVCTCLLCLSLASSFHHWQESLLLQILVHTEDQLRRPASWIEHHWIFGPPVGRQPLLGELDHSLEANPRHSFMNCPVRLSWGNPIQLHTICPPRSSSKFWVQASMTPYCFHSVCLQSHTAGTNEMAQFVKIPDAKSDDLM